MFSRSILLEIKPLVDSGFLLGIKVETESEGMPLLGVSKLQALAAQTSLPLILKIGGCEAISDLRVARDLGVSEIVAPMIESPFAASKFKNALETIYPPGFEPKARILIESVQGLANIESILDISSSFISGVNVGRSDLASSMSLRDGIKYHIDDPIVFEGVKRVLKLGRENNFELTVGGQVTQQSIVDFFGTEGELTPDRFETRRFIFNSRMIANEPEFFETLNRLEIEVAENFAWMALRDSQSLHGAVEQLKTRYRKPKPDLEVL